MGMVEEYECKKKQNTVSWRPPNFTLLYIKNICTMYKDKINYKMSKEA
jgi:hypothetical protein